jgi:hypothetical protein
LEDRGSLVGVLNASLPIHVCVCVCVCVQHVELLVGDLVMYQMPTENM